MFVARAAQAIAAGQAKRGRHLVRIQPAFGARPAPWPAWSRTHTPEAQFETPYGPLYPHRHYAMAATAYLHRFGATREQLAEVAVAAREWALLNPVAYRYGAGPLTVEDVLTAPMPSVRH